MTTTDLIVWGISAIMAIAVGWSRYVKHTTREKLVTELAAMDQEKREKILSRLTGVMRGRTTLLISHRVSTVRHADEIVVLHDGQIVERGTHEELLALNGYYTELYNKQLIEEELERES